MKKLQSKIDKEKGFKVIPLSWTENPQSLVYQAMHQCYSNAIVGEEILQFSEKKCGEIAVRKLLAGERGHYGSLEHPTITFSIGNYPNSLISQLRTHRVGVSFDVQSRRYTKIVEEILENESDERLPDEVIDKYFYLRKPGEYMTRIGKYNYSEKDYESMKRSILKSLKTYLELIENIDAEHAREVLPVSMRQNFVFSGNLRSLMHILDLRCKPNAQLEIVHLSDFIYEIMCEWAPEIMEYYTEKRYKKAKLAP